VIPLRRVGAAECGVEAQALPDDEVLWRDTPTAPVEAGARSESKMILKDL
jgi:hypothetical protein